MGRRRVAKSYAFASVWAKLVMRGVEPVVAAAGMSKGSTLVMLPIVIVLEDLPTFLMSAVIWSAIAINAIFLTAAAYLLCYSLLGMPGAGNLILCTLFIPVVATFLGWGFLAERLTPAALIGFGLIATGLVLIDGCTLHRNGS